MSSDKLVPEEAELNPGDEASAQPLMGHLRELKKRLFRMALWLFVGCAISYIFAGNLIAIFQDTLLELKNDGLPVVPKIINTVPLEVMFTYLRVAVYGGIFLALPLLAWELTAFVGPGLTTRERSRSIWLMISAYAVLLLGVYVGYTVSFPLILKAIVRFGFSSDLSGIEPLWTLSSYITASFGVLLITAFMLELPVFMVHLSAWGWVPVSFWAKGRKLAFVLIAVASAALSPPDVLSMFVVMVPLLILYESGILLSRVAVWAGRDQAKA